MLDNLEDYLVSANELQHIYMQHAEGFATSLYITSCKLFINDAMFFCHIHLTFDVAVLFFLSISSLFFLAFRVFLPALRVIERERNEALKLFLLIPKHVIVDIYTKMTKKKEDDELEQSNEEEDFFNNNFGNQVRLDSTQLHKPSFSGSHDYSLDCLRLCNTILCITFNYLYSLRISS